MHISKENSRTVSSRAVTTTTEPVKIYKKQQQKYYTQRKLHTDILQLYDFLISWGVSCV